MSGDTRVIEGSTLTGGQRRPNATNVVALSFDVLADTLSALASMTSLGVSPLMLTSEVSPHVHDEH